MEVNYHTLMAFLATLTLVGFLFFFIHLFFDYSRHKQKDKD